MLKQRVITALVLAALFLPALLADSFVPLATLTLLLIAAGAWEWGRLNGLGQGAALALGALCMGLCGGSWAAGWLQQPLGLLWLLASALWVLLGALLLRQGLTGWPMVPRSLRIMGGLLMLWLAWLAMAQARVLGVNFLLSALALVWTADISAYFAGKAFGLRFTKSKLAPTISPGKSWEGVWGGVLGVLLLAGLWMAADQYWQTPVASLYTRLAQQGWWLLLVGVVFLVAMSVVGDLVESLIKRSAGAKDSSHLLPGHGGVLDRIDALLPTLPLAMMLSHWARV